MGFLDFLTQPRRSIHEPTPQAFEPMTSPRMIGDDGGITEASYGSPEMMQGAPEVHEKPSLLSGVWDYLKSPQNLAAVAAGLKGLGGDDSGVQQAMELGQQRREATERTAKEAKARADLQAKNAAFKAAYTAGPDGKRRFDPGKYIDALQGQEVDAGEAFSLAHELAPHGGVAGDTAYSIDPLTGETTFGDQREPSHAEQQAEARAAEIERHNREMERLGLMGRETQDYGVHHRVGRGGGGGASWLPPGARVVHVPGGQ